MRNFLPQDKTLFENGAVKHSRKGAIETYRISDPVIARHVLSDPEKYPLGSQLKLMMSMMFPNTILAHDGDEWHDKRNMFGPIFRKRSLNALFNPIIADQLTEVVTTLNENIDQFLNVGYLSQQFTISVMAAGLFGELKPFKNVSSNQPPKLINALISESFNAELSHIPIVRFTLMQTLGIPPWGFKVRVKDIDELSQASQTVLSMVHRARLEDIDIDNLFGDLVRLKNEDGQYALTPRDILNHVHAFLAAGFFTTTTAISFTIHELLKNPEALTKVKEEARQWSSSSLPEDYRVQFPYITNAVKEALRLHPPVHGISRHANVSCSFEQQEVTIKKGGEIVIDVEGLHMNPCNFEDPYDFKPERFDTPPKQGSYMPFGAGPRVCIGQHLAMMEAVNFVQRFFRDFEYPIVKHQFEGHLRSPVFMQPKGSLIVIPEAIPT